jgi:pimeloyl-ACP methyl ester carboxylesterase
MSWEAYMKRVLLVFLCLLVFLPVSGFSCKDPVTQGDYDLSFENITLRDGVSATIHCKVFVNNTRLKHGITIIAIPGASHTAATFEKLAKTVFAFPFVGKLVSNFIAIDMPGHGLSSLPSGLLFGDLNLDDYVNGVINTLNKLKKMKLEPSILIGHSMGTMVAQQLQQTLIDKGSSLKKAYDVEQVILLAPTLPDGMPYLIIDTGAGMSILGQFVTFTPELGAHLAFPDYVWPLVFFSDKTGLPVPNMPSAEEVASKDYNAPESLMFALQVLGAAPYYNRPVIDKEIFGIKKGTLLTVVCFENDILLLPEEGKALFTHLVGKYDKLSRYVCIEGTDAVHDHYISSPEVLAEKIFGFSKRLGASIPWSFACGK